MSIKDTYLRTSLRLVILLLGISFFPVASAGSPPTIPNVFEGNLIAEGASAPAGTIISAYMDSQLLAGTLLQSQENTGLQSPVPSRIMEKK
jgi:hypothetical protein